MTLKEFWESFGESIRIGIHCDTQEKADKLCMAFDRLGKMWQSGVKYEENMTRWKIYKEKTIYFNDGLYGSTDDYPKSWSNIIEFEDIEDFKADKPFTKFDLQDSDIIVLRNQDVKLIQRFSETSMICLGKSGREKFSTLYSSDLKHIDNKEYDVMKVHRNPPGMWFMDFKNAPLVYERLELKEQIVMTGRSQGKTLLTMKALEEKCAVLLCENKQLKTENKILREFKNRAERDFTEADKMLIHIEDIKQKLKVKGFEE